MSDFDELTDDYVDEDETYIDGQLIEPDVPEEDAAHVPSGPIITDVNHDGRVDEKDAAIISAPADAAHVPAGPVITDVNHDGRVDEKDVAIITGAPADAAHVPSGPIITDVNHDGRVDEKDVAIITGAPADAAHVPAGPVITDVNHDGRVDEKDVAIITGAPADAAHVPAGPVITDVNHDGRVDEKDAAIISAQSDSVHVPSGPPVWDVNQDGVVDEEDERILLMQATLDSSNVPLMPLPPGVTPVESQHLLGTDRFGDNLDDAAYLEEIRQELVALEAREKQLLHTPGLSHSKLTQIKEIYYHKIMELVKLLPTQDAMALKRQKPEQRHHVVRNGLLRRNVLNDHREPYKVVFCWAIILAWIVMLLVAFSAGDWAMEDMNLNPMMGPSKQALVDVGAKDPQKIKNQGQIWRFFSANFLHGGVIHLLLDMAVLWRLGWSCEQSYGQWRVCAIYFLSGTFGVLVSTIFTPTISSAAGSAGCFGLLGALFGDFVQNHKYIVETSDGDIVADAHAQGKLTTKFKYLTQLLFATAFGLVLGLMPLLDNFANLGAWGYGAISGVAFMVGTVRDADGGALTNWYTTPLVLVSVLAQIGMWLTAIAALGAESDVVSWCHICDEFTCLETGFWDCAIDTV